MDWLNYHHLYYFWRVAQEGSVTRAAERLRLAPSTVSSQVRSLEDHFGSELLRREGRRVDLTDAGRVVFRYAERIFALGEELSAAIREGATVPSRRLSVGVVDALPKLVAWRLLSPARRLDPPVQLVVHEGRAERLAAELALGDIDLVLADSPVGAGRAHNQLLGETDVSLFGVPALASALRPGFPASLDGAPFVLPLVGTALRRSLDAWFEEQHLRVVIAGEFEDGALLHVFAQGGDGVFAAPTLLADALAASHGVELIGRVPAIREQYWAITADHDVINPIVQAVVDAARDRVAQTPELPVTDPKSR